MIEARSMPGVQVTARPAADRWGILLEVGAGGTLGGRPITAWRASTRAALDLPASGPIVAGGHQPVPWHPGILAKRIAVTTLARRTGAVAIDVVIDQHAGDFGLIEVPCRRSTEALVAEPVRLVACDEHLPMAWHPADRVEDPIPSPPGAIDAWPDAAVRLAAALSNRSDERGAAMQWAGALGSLAEPICGPLRLVAASALLATPLGRALLSAMRDDPDRCAAAYDDAVSSDPGAGLRPLRRSGGGTELPLWRRGPGGRRVGLRVGELPDPASWIPSTDPLLPRALLVTALMRLGVCDLFVHGLGGARYDRLMERWIEAWLGLRPASSAMITAEARLDLLEPSWDPAAPGSAAAALRRAWHDPESEAHRAAGPGPDKRRLLASIAEHPRGSIPRRDRFHAMHRRLRDLRRGHRDALALLRSSCDREVLRAASEAIARRRDWAFLLYPSATLSSLREIIEAAFDPAVEDARIVSRPVPRS